MLYDIQKRVFCVKTYYKLECYTEVQRAYRAEYRCKVAPSTKVIKNVIAVFEKTGAVAKIPAKTKEPSQKRLDTTNELETILKQDSSLSIRKMASSTQSSIFMVFNILHEDLHLKPYKLHAWHKLEDHDYPN